MSNERAGKEAKLDRLKLSISDMADTAAAAGYLRGPGADIADLPWHARRALETGMFPSYARAFNKSKGEPASSSGPHIGAIADRPRDTRLGP